MGVAVRITEAGKALIKSHEGLRLQAYLCPAGVLTIGYGHTGSDVTPGKRISQAEADALFDRDIAKFSAGVARLVSFSGTTDSQFSALVSLAFNIGVGAFGKSSALRLHNAGDHQGAARAFLLWNKATVNGRLQALPGLTRRRNEEAALYLSEEAAGTAMPQAVIGEDGTAAWAAKSRTVAGQGMVGTGTAGMSFAQDAQGWLDTAKDAVGGVMAYLPSAATIFTVLLVAGIGLTLYAKWDDRRKARTA